MSGNKSDLEQFAEDLAFAGAPPTGVIAPQSADHLADTVRALAAEGGALPPCLVAIGGGTTYSAAYVVRDRPHLVISTKGLDRIALSEDGATAEIGAGVTWATAHAWLAERGLQLRLQGPASGLFATLGGSASTNAVGMGSARWGTFADEVRGLEVVTGEGAILRTGSLASRSIEPDPTRSFIGDCGAFGVKTSVALPVSPLGRALDFGGFLHADPPAQHAAAEALTRAGLCEDVIALEVPAVSADKPMLLLEFSTEPARLDEALSLRGGSGTVVAAAILPALRRNPCPPFDMLLDADLRRWSPVHGIVKVGRYAEALGRTREALAGLAETLHKHDVRWALSSMAVGRERILIEANIFIPGRPPAMVRRLLPTEHAERVLAQPARPDADAAGQAARLAVIGALGACGAVHMQTGRLYPGVDRLGPSALAPFKLLKTALDPRGIMNPGVLGLP